MVFNDIGECLTKTTL